MVFLPVVALDGSHVQDDKTAPQMHNFLPLSSQTRVETVKSILFNFLKYVHIAWSNAGAGCESPDSFKRVWMVHISSYLGVNSLATRHGSKC